MSYVNEVLGEGEEVLHVAHFPWYLYALAWLSLLVLGIAVIGIIIFFSIMLYIWTTEIAVTSHRVILKRGWIRRSTEELSLASIEEVGLHQSVFGRMFNFGDVTIRGSGEGLIQIPTISAPAQFRKAIADARVTMQPNHN